MLVELGLNKSELLWAKRWNGLVEVTVCELE